MEYTDEKAKEIIEHFGLKEQIAKLWKCRGRIPDKYADDNYSQPDPIGKADKVKLSRLNEVLKEDVLNLRVICQVSGVDYQKFFDALRGKGRIGSQDVEKVSLELKKLKTFIRNNWDNSPEKLKKLAENPELKFYCIHGKDTWGNTIYKSVHEGRQLFQNDFMKLKDNYMKVYILL